MSPSSFTRSRFSAPSALYWLSDRLTGSPSIHRTGRPRLIRNSASQLAITLLPTPPLPCRIRWIALSPPADTPSLAVELSVAIELLPHFQSLGSGCFLTFKSTFFRGVSIAHDLANIVSRFAQDFHG